ncbi:MAG: YaiI/YqxD family protein [Candidatus Hydrogenedentes bacterium]|nr:YaiI/YqxD family protein [Candidatus Hydrogenedentota bacterium]
MVQIYVDADGCPVKDEVNRVAQRHGLSVTLVANSWMRAPQADWLSLVVVDDGFDAADDWIVEHAQPNDIVITADIPLASRCLKKGAAVLGPKGHPFTEASIGEVLATREIMAHLRESGVNTGGPAPFSKADRSRFLQQLDVMVHACLRAT